MRFAPKSGVTPKPMPKPMPKAGAAPNAPRGIRNPGATVKGATMPKPVAKAFGPKAFGPKKVAGGKPGFRGSLPEFRDEYKGDLPGKGKPRPGLLGPPKKVAGGKPDKAGSNTGLGAALKGVGGIASKMFGKGTAGPSIRDQKKAANAANAANAAKAAKAEYARTHSQIGSQNPGSVQNKSSPNIVKQIKAAKAAPKKAAKPSDSNRRFNPKKKTRQYYDGGVVAADSNYPFGQGQMSTPAADTTSSGLGNNSPLVQVNADAAQVDQNPLQSSPMQEAPAAMKKGGAVKSKASRGNGIAQRGKTKGRMV
jgi:hypothetical protein